MTTLPNPQMLEVPDAETLKEFESNARAAWRLGHPEKRKRRGRKSFEKEAYILISEAWLELRNQTGMTQYKIWRRAWKKNKTKSPATYKKYTSKFVLLLATAGSQAQLNDNDRKLLEKAMPTLTKEVATYQRAIATAIEESKESIVPTHAARAKALGQAAADVYDVIVRTITKNSSIPLPE